MDLHKKLYTLAQRLLDIPKSKVIDVNTIDQPIDATTFYESMCDLTSITTDVARQLFEEAFRVSVEHQGGPRHPLPGGSGGSGSNRRLARRRKRTTPVPGEVPCISSGSGGSSGVFSFPINPNPTLNTRPLLGTSIPGGLRPTWVATTTFSPNVVYAQFPGGEFGDGGASSSGSNFSDPQSSYARGDRRIDDDA